VKKSYIIGLLVIGAFVAFGASAFKNAAARYVTFAEAKAATVTVQVKGKLDPDSLRLDRRNHALHFDLVNAQGERLPVVYAGPEPANLRQAPEVVAVGRYAGSALEAERLLVKCPSKYEGQGEHPGNVPVGE